MTTATEKTFTCRTCGAVFETRKEMAAHVHYEHVRPKQKPKRFTIPREMVEEFQFLGTSGYARLQVDGELTEKGLEVDTIKYVR